MSEKEQEQIKKLKEVALVVRDYDGKKSAVEAIAAYGEAAIPALIEVSQKAHASVRLRWLSVSARCRSWAEGQRLEDSESTVSDGKELFGKLEEQQFRNKHCARLKFRS